MDLWVNWFKSQIKWNMSQNTSQNLEHGKRDNRKLPPQKSIIFFDFT